MREHLGPEKWRRLVTEFEESRQTQKEFAASKGVSLGTFQFWVYKLRKEARRASTPAALLPVEVVSSTALSAREGTAPTGAPFVEAALPSGVVLRFLAGTDVGYVRALLLALG